MVTILVTELSLAGQIVRGFPCCSLIIPLAFATTSGGLGIGFWTGGFAALSVKPFILFFSFTSGGG